MQVALRLAIAGRVYGSPCFKTPVRSTSVSEVTAKDEQLASTRLTRRRSCVGDSIMSLDAIALCVNGYVYRVTTADDF